MCKLGALSAHWNMHNKYYIIGAKNGEGKTNILCIFNIFVLQATQLKTFSPIIFMKVWILWTGELLF